MSDDREDHLVHGVDYPLCKVCKIGLPGQHKREGEDNFCSIHDPKHDPRAGVRAVKRFIAPLLLLFMSVGVSGASPEDAIVRLTSHGCSGTVVWSGNGRALILTCAHSFEGNDERRQIVLDSPSPRPGVIGRPGVRLTKVDHKLDLALVEIGKEMPYVTPVAPVGHRPGRLVSAGYDGIKGKPYEVSWPAVKFFATSTGKDAFHTYTREHPIEGRSGGPLLDWDSGLLIGTCTGYFPAGPGIYTSHEAVLKFIGWAAAPEPFQLPQRYGQPQVREQREWMPGNGPQLQLPAGGLSCPAPRGFAPGAT